MNINENWELGIRISKKILKNLMKKSNYVSCIMRKNKDRNINSEEHTIRTYYFFILQATRGT